MPFRSVPEEAAVGEVFGTLAGGRRGDRDPVDVDAELLATTCATLMNSPCPISVPPWFRCTDPSW
jgi:hypothetical protein